MKRWLLLLLVFACALGWTGLMSVDLGGRQGASTAGGYTVEVKYFDQSDFPEVTVYLTVLDDDGEPVLGLTEGDFSVSEDDVPARIADFIPGGVQPVTAVMLIDRSGSMNQSTKMRDAIDAALTFLDRLQNGRDRLGVVAFDNETNSLGSLRTVSDDSRDDLTERIEDLSPEGGTAYYDAVYEAVDMLGDTSGRKVVLALTDGKDEHSDRDRDDVLDYAQDHNVVLYTIGLGNDVRDAVLSEMGQSTGGQYYEEPSSGELAELYAELARSLQDEYSLSYTSPTPRLDGTTRSVAVTVQSPAGAITSAGDYAVGGTFTPSLNLWPCLAALPLLLMLALPVFYDKLRGRGELAEAEAAPQPQAVVSYPSEPPPSTSPHGGTAVMDESAVPAMACSNCGRELRSEARFCPSCGQSVSEEPREERACSNCGASLRPSAKFCATCGQPLRTGAGVEQDALRCPHCGVTLQSGAGFCANCGRRV